jgi:hypothetical protein
VPIELETACNIGIFGFTERTLSCTSIKRIAVSINSSRQSVNVCTNVDSIYYGSIHKNDPVISAELVHSTAVSFSNFLVTKH